MQIIQDHRVACFDIDETLLMFDWKDYTSETGHLMYLDDCAVLPNHRNIDLLLQFKARGFTIIAWSQGGYAYAAQAIALLGLESKVDYVMSKPNWYIDDLHASAWMGKNIWLHPTDKEKDNR